MFVPTKTALEVSTSTLSRAPAFASRTHAPTIIISTPKSAPASARDPPMDVIPVITGTTTFADASVTETTSVIPAITWTSTTAPASVHQMSVESTKSGMKNSAHASAAPSTALTTSTGALTTVSANALQLIAPLDSHGTRTTATAIVCQRAAQLSIILIIISTITNANASATITMVAVMAVMSLTLKSAHASVNPKRAHLAHHGAASIAIASAHLKSAQPRSTGAPTLTTPLTAAASAIPTSARLATTGTKKFATVFAHLLLAITPVELEATGTAPAADAANFHQSAMKNQPTQFGTPLRVVANALRTQAHPAILAITSTMSHATACVLPRLAQMVSTGTLASAIAVLPTVLALLASTSTSKPRIVNACHSHVLQVSSGTPQIANAPMPTKNAHRTSLAQKFSSSGTPQLATAAAGSPVLSCRTSTSTWNHVRSNKSTIAQ